MIPTSQTPTFPEIGMTPLMLLKQHIRTLALELGNHEVPGPAISTGVSAAGFQAVGDAIHGVSIDGMLAGTIWIQRLRHEEGEGLCVMLNSMLLMRLGFMGTVHVSWRPQRPLFG